MKIFDLFSTPTATNFSRQPMSTRESKLYISLCMQLYTHTHAHTHRLLVAKMKHVFEQVMLVDGTRHMKPETIQKTFKAAEFLVKFIMKSRALYDE